MFLRMWRDVAKHLPDECQTLVASVSPEDQDLPGAQPLEHGAGGVRASAEGLLLCVLVRGQLHLHV